MTRLGNFFKKLVTKISTKVAKCFVTLGYFENTTFHVKTAVAAFWPTFGKFGPLVISASGHTVHVKPDRVIR